MADFSWSVREDGAVELEDYLDRAGLWASDMRSPLNDSADSITAVMAMQFLTEGDYRSGGWDQLSDSYKTWKDHVAPGMPILELTREMMLTTLDREASWRVTKEDAVFSPVGPHSELFGLHQLGDLERMSGGPNHDRSNPLPARPILDLDEMDYEQIRDHFEDWLEQIVLPAFPEANVARGPFGRFISFGSF